MGWHWFFLGGIGPDGHIAFNMRGSDHEAPTHLVKLNYESATTAAWGLGGIDYARDKVAITIGLKTITSRPDATIIIMAAGEAKAPIVAQSLQSQKSTQYPASSLISLPHARFYLTKSAASHLIDRRCEDLQKNISSGITDALLEEVLCDVALAADKALLDLNKQDFYRHQRGRLMLDLLGNEFPRACKKVHQSLVEKLESGLMTMTISNKTIFHTSPHHDDVMLSYYPCARKLLANNNNYFIYATSGFDAVTNDLVKRYLNAATPAFVQTYKEDIFEQPYQILLQRFRDAFHNSNQKLMSHVEQLIALNRIRTYYHVTTPIAFQEKCSSLKHYFEQTIPGQKDTPEIQTLKGTLRETEADRLWINNGVDQASIIHLRSKFYTGNFFNTLPSIEHDAQPIADLLEKTHPDIVTVAFDPEGTGPDTHYKVLRIVAEALRLKQHSINPLVWGYRNVWHRFAFGDVNLMIPAEEHHLQNLHKSFMQCFSSQKKAPFPSHEHDGPFSELSINIQRDQLKQLHCLLGKDFFDNHHNPSVRNAAGIIFLKQMSFDELSAYAQKLKDNFEMANIRL